MNDHDPRDDYDDEPWRGRLAPEEIVRWPASAMWVFGLLQFIITQLWLAFFGIALVVTHFVDDDKSLAEAWDTVKEEEAIWLSLVVWPVATACTIVVMRGANDLRRFRRYWWVVAAAILTVLAVPFVYLAVVQLPLGIWLIALLVRRDVRARFAAVQRGRPAAEPTSFQPPDSP